MGGEHSADKNMHNYEIAIKWFKECDSNFEDVEYLLGECYGLKQNPDLKEKLKHMQRFIKKVDLNLIFQSFLFNALISCFDLTFFSHLASESKDSGWSYLLEIEKKFKLDKSQKVSFYTRVGLFYERKKDYQKSRIYFKHAQKNGYEDAVDHLFHLDTYELLNSKKIQEKEILEFEESHKDQAMINTSMISLYRKLYDQNKDTNYLYKAFEYSSLEFEKRQDDTRCAQFFKSATFLYLESGEEKISFKEIEAIVEKHKNSDYFNLDFVYEIREEYCINKYQSFFSSSLTFNDRISIIQEIKSIDYNGRKTLNQTCILAHLNDVLYRQTNEIDFLREAIAWSDKEIRFEKRAKKQIDPQKYLKLAELTTEFLIKNKENKDEFDKMLRISTEAISKLTSNDDKSSLLLKLGIAKLKYQTNYHFKDIRKSAHLGNSKALDILKMLNIPLWGKKDPILTSEQKKEKVEQPLIEDSSDEKIIISEGSSDEEIELNDEPTPFQCINVSNEFEDKVFEAFEKFKRQDHQIAFEMTRSLAEQNPDNQILQKLLAVYAIKGYHQTFNWGVEALKKMLPDVDARLVLWTLQEQNRIVGDVTIENIDHRRVSKAWTFLCIEEKEIEIEEKKEISFKPIFKTRKEKIEIVRNKLGEIKYLNEVLSLSIQKMNSDDFFSVIKSLQLGWEEKNNKFTVCDVLTNKIITGGHIGHPERTIDPAAVAKVQEYLFQKYVTDN